MHRPSSIALAGLLATAIGASSGCVVAIGNRPSPSSEADRIKLDRDDLGSIPEVESATELPSFDAAYAEQLRTLTPETTVERFRSLFPEAQFVERSAAYETPVDAYSVTHEQVYRYDGERKYGYMKKEERWFYFRDGLFVKQGKARDWPAPVRGEGQ